MPASPPPPADERQYPTGASRETGSLKASQDLEREAPLTAAGTRMRQRDHTNEWVAYSMVVLITVLIGNLGERIHDRRNGTVRELPPELTAALKRQENGGRLDENPVTGMPRNPDDPAREKELVAKIKADATDVASLKGLADYYADTMQVDKAIERYNAALDLSPDDAEIMTSLAIMQFAQGTISMQAGVLPKDMDPNSGPVAAVATLMEATEVDPTYVPAWQTLGWAYTQIGQRQKALEAYQHAEENSTDPQMKHGFQQLISQLSDQAQAPLGAPGTKAEMNPLTGGPVLPTDPAKEKLLQDAIANNPGDADSALQLGHYYYDTYQPAKAVAAYELYLSRGGDPSPGMKVDYATVLSEVDLDKAVSVMDEVAQANQEFAPAWNNLAHLRFRTGDKSGALAAILHAYPLVDPADRPTLAATIEEWGGTVPE